MSIFDFTNLYKSRNACQVLAQGEAKLLVAVVGDSLMEPFWPEVRSRREHRVGHFFFNFSI